MPVPGLASSLPDCCLSPHCPPVSWEFQGGFHSVEGGGEKQRRGRRRGRNTERGTKCSVLCFLSRPPDLGGVTVETETRSGAAQSSRLSEEGSGPGEVDCRMMTVDLAPADSSVSIWLFVFYFLFPSNTVLIHVICNVQ